MLRWRDLCLYVVGSAIVACSGGCSMFVGVSDYLAYNDATNDIAIGWRNTVWARQSWHENKAAFVDQPYFREFGTGYRAGYHDVASGGNGCPPPLPPRHLWSWKFQTPEGQGKIAAWFAGYPHGAAAAEVDQAGEWMQIPVSSSIETQYSPEFQDGTICLPDELRQQLREQRPSGSYGAREGSLEQLPLGEPRSELLRQPASDSGASIPWHPAREFQRRPAAEYAQSAPPAPGMSPPNSYGGDRPASEVWQHSRWGAPTNEEYRPPVRVDSHFPPHRPEAVPAGYFGPS